MKKALLGAAVAAAISFYIPTMAMAQDASTVPVQDPFASRSDNLPPALSFLVSKEVKLTYLGEVDGLQGYLGESSDGKQQVFYLLPSGEHIIAGLLFNERGVNLTGVQIESMRARYEALVRQSEADTSAEQEASPPTPGGRPQTSSAISGIVNIGDAPKTEVALQKSVEKTLEDYRSHMDKADFLSMANQVPFFTIGDPNSSPTLWMIADPNCPYCHRAWAELKPMVAAGQFALNVILVAGLPGSEEKAVSILTSQDPGALWWNGQGSTKNIPVNPAPAADSQQYQMGVQYLRISMAFAASMRKDPSEQIGTPFFVYEGEDGTLYSDSGPKDLNVFLSGIRD